MIWSNGKSAFSYWQPDTYEEEESLGMAIAGAAGISGSAAYNVPTMLTKETSGFKFTDLQDLKLAQDETFEGELCYHIKGRRSSGEPEDLWISKKDYLLRKLHREFKYEDYISITDEIHRKIKINLPIARKVFEFQPPIALTPKETNESAGNDSLLTSESPNWTEFVSNEGRFRVLLPEKPTTHSLTFETGAGRVVHYGFRAGGGGIFCNLDYADLPKMVAGNEKAIFDEVRDAFLKEAQVSLASEKSITLEGHPGREISIHLLGGEVKARFYLVNSRLYQLAITRFDISENSSALVDKFFGSFKIMTEPKPTAAARRMATEARC